MEQSYSIQKWITGCLWLLTGLTAIVSYLGYAFPDTFSGWLFTGTASTLTLTDPLGLYLARNVATVAMSSFALSSRSVTAYMCVFILLVVTDGLNVLHFALDGKFMTASIFLDFFIIETVALKQLSKQYRHAS